MPRENGPFMTNANRKRLEALRAAQEKARRDEEKYKRIQDAQARRRAKSEPLELDLRTSDTGGHHCALNDRGVHHRTAPACFSKEHMGACPTCRKPVSARAGCPDCEVKGRDLQYDNLIFPANPRAKPLVQVDRIRGIIPWGHKKMRKTKQEDDTQAKAEPTMDRAKKGGSWKESRAHV